ncbi:MAG: hypothetical protein WDM85_14670 [Caulobacteraceae bacterium]
MIRRGRYLRPRTEPAPAESAQLEREGYAVIRGLLSNDEVAELAQEVGAVFERDPPDERGPRDPEDAAMFRYAMLNRSAAAQRGHRPSRAAGGDRAATRRRLPHHRQHRLAQPGRPARLARRPELAHRRRPAHSPAGGRPLARGRPPSRVRDRRPYLS